MAHTSAQKVSVRYWLGWPAYGSSSSNDDLQTAIESIDAHPDSASILTVVDTIIAKLVIAEAAITTAQARLKAWRVGSIELNRNEIFHRAHEGQRLVVQLSAIYGVARLVDVFGVVSATSGDNWYPHA